MKKKSCFVWVILAALLLMMTAGCGSKEEDIKATMAKMVGSWDYFPEDADNYQIRYIISQDGFITQQAWAYDDEGNEIDLSLGDMAGFSFEVISKDTIKLLLHLLSYCYYKYNFSSNIQILIVSFYFARNFFVIN